MKHLKKFEYFNNHKNYTIDDIKVGDYVKANYGSAMEPAVVEFLDENFGIVTEINKAKQHFFASYKNVPEGVKFYFMESGYMTLHFNIVGLQEFASTEEELELKIASGKFNI